MLGYRHDLTPFVEALLRLLDTHALGPGRYSRFTTQSGHAPELDAYGCADAANILYTIGQFPQHPDERQCWVEALQAFQDPSTGIFENKAHSAHHTTAHVVGALELFDARPRYPLTFLQRLLAEQGLYSFMGGLEWDDPWNASHAGAGCCAALAVTGEAPPEWFGWYFGWLDCNVDPETGLWRRGRIKPLNASPGRFANLAGTFHYHFNYSYFRLPLPYAEQVVDTCLALLETSPFPLAQNTVSFAEIDLIFCLNRAQRQSEHRREETLAALRDLGECVIKVLSDEAYQTSAAFDDLHLTFGAVCALAEVQAALPGFLHTPRPLKLVLDRRPFI